MKGNNFVKIKPAHAYLLLLFAVFSAFAAEWFINARWGDLKTFNETLHSAIEAIGATLALLMSVLLLQKKDDEHGGKFFLLAMGFMGMGVFDGLHAVSTMGHGFIMLHTVSIVTGSIWFSLVWFPLLASDKAAEWKKIVPWFVVGGSILLGLFALAGGQPMPVMLHQGEFSFTAKTVHFFAGVLFTASAVRFVIDYYTYRSPEFGLFASMMVLFGSAGFSYSVSSIWDITWWFWHVLRLTAYLAAFIFFLLDRKRVEDQLRKSRQVSGDRLAELKTIYATAPIGLCFVDTGFRIKNMNNRLSEMAGIPVESAVGRTVRELMPEGADLLESRLRQVMETGMPIEGREFHGTVNAYPYGERDLVVSYYPVKDKAGIVFGVNVVVQDITEHKVLETELKSLNRRHKLILDAADEGILGMDTRGDHTFVNHNAAAMLGYDCDEFIGRHSHPIWHHTKPDGSPYAENECNIYATLRDGIVRRIADEVFWRKDGTSFAVEYATTPFYEKGQIAGTVVTFRDITSRKAAEEHLKRVLSELERSNKELEEFAYMASHDLQEPLRMVSSFLQLLENKYKGQLDEKADQYIAFAVDGAVRMQSLIVDLLAYSRLLRKAEFQPVDLTQVLKEAVANLSVVIRESSATVTSDNLPTVSGDKSRLVQLFQNLISNAIKFRKPDVPSLVHVSAKKEGREWVFSVRDNGIGIEPEYYDRIFLIFQRLHTRDEYPGTGIGLTLCKKIVEGHNGRIWVESKPGEGTTFYFAIPVYKGGEK